MDIKEAFLKNRISKTIYMETIVVDKFYNDRFVWHKCSGYYNLKDTCDKHYEDYLVNEYELVSLKNVDWDKCFYHYVRLDLSDLISMVERLGSVNINMNYINRKWFVYSDYVDVSCTSFRDALLNFLFEYACSQDKTIYRAE